MLNSGALLTLTCANTLPVSTGAVTGAGTDCAGIKAGASNLNSGTAVFKGIVKGVGTKFPLFVGA